MPARSGAEQPGVVAVTFARSEPMKNRDNAGLHIENRQIQYIARISHGKDSMKMLDVIISRGLKLDRITTTDIWATETIRGEYPEMVKFKERADEYIWQIPYRGGTACALCGTARNRPMKDCSTMFQSGNLRGGALKTGKILGFPTPCRAVVPISSRRVVKLTEQISHITKR